MEQSTRPPVRNKDIAAAHVFLLLQQCTIVALYFLGKQVIGDGLAAAAYVTTRLSLALPFFIVSTYWATKRLLPEKKYLPLLALSGVLSIVATQALQAYGLSRTTATNASIISAPCTPLFTTALSVIRGTDKMSVSKAVGFVLAVAGALILLQIENFSFEGKELGNLLIVLMSLCSAANTLVQRKLLDDGMHPLAVITHATFFGLVAFIAVFSHMGLFHADNWVVPTSSWIKLLIIAIVCTAIPWNLATVALKHTSPLTVSIYVVLQPPIAAILGIFLGEEYTWHQGVGTVLVLAGLAFVNFSSLLVAARTYFERKVLHAENQFHPLKSEVDDKEEVELAEMIDANTGVIAIEKSQDEKVTTYTFEAKQTNNIVKEEP